MVGRSHLYASGAYADSMKNNTGRSFPQCRLDAWQRPGNLRQAGYVHTYQQATVSASSGQRPPSAILNRSPSPASGGVPKYLLDIRVCEAALSLRFVKLPELGLAQEIFSASGKLLELGLAERYREKFLYSDWRCQIPGLGLPERWREKSLRSDWRRRPPTAVKDRVPEVALAPSTANRCERQRRE